mmetsp:Transcript_14250/g.35368  ORF Transcript_14250/g.35368 Transcript_14250/m.35368 type:complete len:324 (+) Transcript_14250:534-1505(+)
MQINNLVLCRTTSTAIEFEHFRTTTPAPPKRQTILAAPPSYLCFAFQFVHLLQKKHRRTALSSASTLRHQRPLHAPFTSPILFPSQSNHVSTSSKKSFPRITTSSEKPSRSITSRPQSWPRTSPLVFSRRVCTYTSIAWVNVLVIFLFCSWGSSPGCSPKCTVNCCVQGTSDFTSCCVLRVIMATEDPESRIARNVMGRNLREAPFFGWKERKTLSMLQYPSCASLSSHTVLFSFSAPMSPRNILCTAGSSEIPSFLCFNWPDSYNASTKLLLLGARPMMPSKGMLWKTGDSRSVSPIGSRTVVAGAVALVPSCSSDSAPSFP